MNAELFAISLNLRTYKEWKEESGAKECHPPNKDF